jgi:uncharacterized protein YbcI
MIEEHRRPVGGRINQDIANAVVRTRKRAFGHGPVAAYSFFRHNVIVVVMEDPLNEAERAVCAAGGEDEVRHMRMRLEETLRATLVEAVKELTGCNVEAFMTAHHVAPDVTMDIFVLDGNLQTVTTPL